METICFVQNVHLQNHALPFCTAPVPATEWVRLCFPGILLPSSFTRDHSGEQKRRTAAAAAATITCFLQGAKKGIPSPVHPPTKTFTALVRSFVRWGRQPRPHDDWNKQQLTSPAGCCTAKASKKTHLHRCLHLIRVAKIRPSSGRGSTAVVGLNF